MTHLTDVELVDLLDGALAPARERHLDECESCRATAEQLREAFARAADVKIPEPSPLFWEHFSARVHEGVRAAEGGERSRWFGWASAPAVKWAMSGAMLTLLLISALWVSLWRTNAPVPEETASTASVAAEDPDRSAFDPETDEAWALVRTVADDVTWDEAAADRLGVGPGSVEHAMATLTGDERSELMRLLEAATKKRGA